MSSIGDKKVALNLSDGTSVNLNKPTVLDNTVTRFFGLKNGEYCGVCTYTKSGDTTYIPSISDFPTGNVEASSNPGQRNYFLKVMDTIGDDDSYSQIFYCQLGIAAYIGIVYAQAPASIDDDNASQTADQTASNTNINWAGLVSADAFLQLANTIPHLTDGAYDPTSDYSKNDRAKHTINAHTTDWLADAINLHILKPGADLNTLLTTGKYAINNFAPVNGPVIFTLVKSDENSKSYIQQIIISDASKVPSTVDHADNMPITNGVLSVDYLGVDNSVTQTLICDKCIARRVITGLSYTYDSSADPIIIKRPDTATEYGSWHVFMSVGVDWEHNLDNITNVYGQQACSMTDVVLLNDRIKMLQMTQQRIDVIDNLTSTSTDDALSANQGRVLNDKISKLTKTDTVGSAANPVYMKNGAITAGTYTFSASTTDLTAGSSTLATNEIRFIYE